MGQNAAAQIETIMDNALSMVANIMTVECKRALQKYKKTYIFRDTHGMGRFVDPETNRLLEYEDLPKELAKFIDFYNSIDVFRAYEIGEVTRD